MQLWNAVYLIQYQRQTKFRCIIKLLFCLQQGTYFLIVHVCEHLCVCVRAYLYVTLDTYMVYL